MAPVLLALTVAVAWPALDPNGHAQGSVYDGANRLRVEIAGAGSAVEARTTHWYDGSGNRVRTKGPRGTWAYDLLVEPDDLGRPVRTSTVRSHAWPTKAEE